MEAVNSFVMSWWPVFAGIFAVLVLLAQLWNNGLQREMTAAHERATALDSRVDTLEKEFHTFQLHASERFVTSAEVTRLTASIDSLKNDLSAWLERIESTLQRKADKP